MNDYIAGAIAGSAGVFVGHPFDTVKVQLQVQQSETRYKSLSECLSAIKKQDLSKGFFRGLSWPLLSQAVINSVFFGVYGYTLRLMGVCSNSTGDNKHATRPEYLKIVLAGCIGGVFQLIPAGPVEVIKVALQSQIPHGSKVNPGVSSKFYKGPIQGTVNIVKMHGIRGMYRGLPVQFLRDVPASGLYFLIFEFLNYEGSTRLKSVPPIMVNFVSGGFAGLLSWAAIIPFDVIKSRVQADTEHKAYKGFMDCAIKSYKEDGLKVFFRGLGMVSLRAFPVNAVTLMVHAEFMQLLSSN